MSAKHYSMEEWAQYAEGGLDDQVREDFENHLYECDMCMTRYVELLEGLHTTGKSQEEPYVEASEAYAPGSALADRVMTAIQELEAVTAALVPESSGAGAGNGDDRAKRSRRRTPLFRSPMFHYTVAAAITLVLMSTGMFHNVSQRVEHMERQSSQQREPFSERLMEKTVSMLEAVQAQRGGEKHE